MSKTYTPLSKDIEAANHKIKYDTQVKKVLANKIILAWILKYTVKEFAHTSIPEIETCIEGNIEIGTVPVEPGLTNYSSILGANNENAIPNEGKITFDLRFHVILPDGNQTKIIINIEAQKNSEPGYDIVTRGIFYSARLLSAQLNQEFTNSSEDPKKYDNIKKVYSIWICMESSATKKDSIIEYHIEPHTIHNNGKEKINTSRYDLLSVVMIHLGGDEIKSDNELVNMLTTLLSSRIDLQEKKQQLQETYQIPMEQELEQEVNEMCNLSDYVEEKGMKKGIEQGMEKGMQQGMQQGNISAIHKMLNKGLEPSQIADLLDESVEYIEKIQTIILQNPSYSNEDILKEL